jgi:hypothetical protein
MSLAIHFLSLNSYIVLNSVNIVSIVPLFGFIRIMSTGRRCKYLACSIMRGGILG